MFKFFRIHSYIFISFTWFLLFALFADAANLDDCLPHSFSIHLDDIDMINQNVIDAMLIPVTGSTGTSLHHANDVGKHTQKRPNKDVVILYDLDSLCVAAYYSFEKETIISQSSNRVKNSVNATSAKKESSRNLFLLFQSFII